MDLLFLHLTDLHVSTTNSFDELKINGIKNAINTIGNFDNAIIVFTGDIAYSGIASEYLMANEIIRDLYIFLQRKINKYINVLVVPGNHDVYFNEKQHSRVEIKKEIDKNANNEEHYYIKMMEDFFDFSHKYHCFEKNKIIDIKYLKLDDFNLRINLVNSATFSTFKDEIKDYDEGLHQLSDDNLSLLTKKTKKDFEITLMHHSPELFADVSKQIINNYLRNNNNILFYGHDHKSVNELSLVNDCVCQKMLGGPLLENEKSIFNAIILDTETLNTKNYKFIWNNIINIYDCEKQSDNSLESFPNHNFTFINELLNDKLLSEIDDFRKIYVFPELHIENFERNDNKKTISDFKSFLQEIHNKKYCVIEGYDESGKTSLSKIIYLKYALNDIPVLFKSENINGTKISKVIETLVREQYNKNVSFSLFEQYDKEMKIAIIDDADKIEKKQFEVLLENIKDKFGKIIIIKGQRTENDIVSYLKENINDNNDSIKFRIELMYRKKREELLKKLCTFFKPEISNNNLKIFANKINKMISNEINIFNLNPSFIILFTKSALSNNFEFGSAKVFNTIFQSNITKIIQYDSQLDPNITIYLLQKIAFYIHSHKEYPLSPSNFSKIIETYNNERKRYLSPIKPNEFLQRLINVRIFAYADIEGNIKFSYNSYLSFFIAKEILYNRDDIALNKLIENICFGLNADILLFLCYLTDSNNNAILKLIVDKAKNFFSPYEELNFSKSNIKYLLLKGKALRLEMPTSNKINKKAEIIDKKERYVKKADIIRVQDIYDYDESLLNTQKMINLTGIKYIEIISKILPDFIHSLEPSQIDIIIEAIYKFPNQHLYCFFKDFDNSIDDILNELKLSHINEFDYLNEVEEIKAILNKIQKISLIYILDVYHITIHYSTSKNTKFALENFDYNGNINYEFINAFIYDSLGETNILGKKLCKIYENCDNESIKNLCKIIFFNHCLNNQVKNYGETQYYINKFLGSKVSKEKMQRFRAPVQK